MEAKSESQCAALTVWSLWRDQWVSKKGAAASKVTKLHGHLEKWTYPRIQWAVQNHAPFLKLFQRMLCHPSHIAHTLLHMANRPKSTCHAPLKVMHMCWFKGYWDAHLRHTLRICTPSNWNKTSIKFPSHQHYCLHSRQVSGDDVGVAGGGLGGRPSNERIDVWYTLIVWVIKVVSLWDEWGEGRGKENRRAKVWEKGDGRKTGVVGERKAKRSRRKRRKRGRKNDSTIRTILTMVHPHPLYIQKYMPRQQKIIHTCWFKGNWDAHSRHTLWICTP